PSCKGGPAPYLGVAGTADPVVPFNGGRVNCCGGATLAGAPAAAANWAKHNRGNAKFTETRLGSEGRRRTWAGRAPDAHVVFYIVDGGGHTWPGSIPIERLGMTTKQLNASATIWDFFKAHPHS